MSSRSDNENMNSPWLCHVCGAASRSESITCDFCFRTVCQDHLRRVPMRNAESGLYHFTSLCVHCIAEKVIG